MASGLEWKKYFKKKSIKYIEEQLRVIDYILNNADPKIKAEFQLNYLVGVRGMMISSMREITEKNYKKEKSMGGVF